MFEFNESLKQALSRNVQDALLEDIGTVDWTAQLVPENQQAKANVVIKQGGAIICGQAWFELCIKSLDPQARIQWFYAEGQLMEKQTPVCEIVCNARALLSAERAALNFLQTLSWTASSTKVYVDAIADIDVNLRGCKITTALANAKALNSGVMIQIKVKSMAELEEALSAGAENILLDDFSLEEMRKAVEINRNRAELEVSGGVEMSKLREIALTGIDRISVGALTKDVIAVDFSMRVLERIE